MKRRGPLITLVLTLGALVVILSLNDALIPNQPGAAEAPAGTSVEPADQPSDDPTGDAEFPDEAVYAGKDTTGKVAVAVVSLFIVGRGRLRGRASSQSLLLTVSGSASSFFQREEGELLEVLKRRSSGTTIQRFDIEDGQVQFRASLSLRGLEDTTALMAELQSKLPGYQISYTNLESLA